MALNVDVTLPVAMLVVIVAPALLTPMRPPMTAPFPVAVTGLPALRFDRFALLSPISPPACAKPPVLTAPEAVELVICPVALLLPTRPPINASGEATPVPLTLPDALDDAIEPAFCPTRPPAEPAPPLTVVEAVELPMLPLLSPTSPPNVMKVLVSAPIARLMIPLALAF